MIVVYPLTSAQLVGRCPAFWAAHKDTDPPEFASVESGIVECILHRKSEFPVGSDAEDLLGD